MHKIIILFLILFNTILKAQVGIGTTSPLNDFHVNGGVRIDNRPSGSDEDSVNRLLATDLDGNVVQVQASQIVSTLGIPTIAYNAKFGTSAPNLRFFNGCNNCSIGFTGRFILESPLVNIDNATVTLIDPSNQNGDEYFEIQEAGVYNFDVKLVAGLTGNGVWLLNLQFVVESGGNTTFDSFRFFSGQPSTGVNNPLAIPGGVSDVRLYNVGDRVYFNMVIASLTNPNQSLSSNPPFGGSSSGQITITKY